MLTLACSEAPTATGPDGAIDLAAPWQRALPESLGVDAAQLVLAGEVAGQIERMRSMLVVRGGKLIHEQYFGGWTPDTLADVRSVTKSVVSTLTGIALEQGHLASLDQPIADHLDPPEFELSAAQHLITIRHLLTMTGGWDSTVAGPSTYNEWILSGDHIGYLLDRDITNTPGETFAYNSAATFLLGVIVEKAVGQPLAQYADEVLFGPLGIRERRWEELSVGYANGGSGLDLRPRDLARFGQLFLQEGWSGDKQIVPSAWVDEATNRKLPWTSPTGPIDRSTYGFLWWVDLDNRAYFARGFGGQFVYVAPRQDLVVVATTEWRGVRDDIGPGVLQESILNIIVDRILVAAS